MKGIRIDLATGKIWDNQGPQSDDYILLHYFNAVYGSVKERDLVMRYYRPLISPLSYYERVMTSIPYRPGWTLYLGQLDYYLERQGVPLVATEDIILYMVEKLQWRYLDRERIIVGKIWGDDE
jgi:hypothetical protein